MSAALDRAILRESARVRAVAQDCRSRITRLARLAALLRAALREPPPRPGEARVDSGALAAWIVGVLLCLGAVLLAAIGAAVVGRLAP